MSSPRNLQRRSQSSIRNELARNLHDSIAQDLAALGFQIDLLSSCYSATQREDLRKLRSLTDSALVKVRREMFALREHQFDVLDELTQSAGACKLEVIGNPNLLSKELQRVLNELTRNAATYSKGHLIKIDIAPDQITISDDGRGMYGVAEAVEELGGSLKIESTRFGTKVTIGLL